MIFSERAKALKIGLKLEPSNLLSLIIYAILSLYFFGWHRGWTSHWLGKSQDPVQFAWFLNWWPFAIAHGLNPFLSRFVWFPGGFNLAWCTSVPFLSFISLPITLISGPILSLNLLTIMAPALSAWTAFLLAHYISRDWASALVGGYLFGFSSYELGHMLAHLNLIFICLIPIVILLCLQRINDKLSRQKFILLLTIVLFLQLGISSEILATLCTFGAISWAIFFALAPSSDRLKLSLLASEIIIAVIFVCFLSAPFLFYLISGFGFFPQTGSSPQFYSTDLMNYIIPTNVTHFGKTIYAPLANKFSGNTFEQGAYLGLPIIFIILLYFRDNMSRRYTQALLIVISALVIFSLGPWLHVGGLETHIPMPWILVDRLPLLRSALPSRFPMYVALCSSIVVTLYLADENCGRWRTWRFVLAGLACFCLIPNRGAYPWQPWEKQPFFTPNNVQLTLGKNQNVLILPYAWTGPGMAWQLDAGMNFTQSGGYIGSVPQLEQKWNNILADLTNGTAGPNFEQNLVEFCSFHHVHYVLIGPGTPKPLLVAIKSLNWPERLNHGVIIVDVPKLL
ncbi:glycosyltransferase family protein [Acidocella aminolytica]|nr:YfhO family protein [Acidocella aminolytica]SHF37213.1 hypothetical protein SAMN02746095_03004 [Acidocella aminolytica 101 = DSM 11237]